MIELAPQHKIGLAIDNPVMAGAGFWGYGQPQYSNLIQANQFGAIVTNPITLRPRPHQTEPRALEMNGGLLLSTLPRNPGVRTIINRYQRFWRRAASPIIAHLPADAAADLARTAGALAGLGRLSGFELSLPSGIAATEVKPLIQAIQSRSELPLLVKLPTDNIVALAEAVLNLGADGLVVSQPELSTVYQGEGQPFHGYYYGPGILPQRLPLIHNLRQQFPQVPLIASGGIHTAVDVQAYLQAGAIAIQLDSLIFINPMQAQQILSAFHEPISIPKRT